MISNDFKDQMAYMMFGMTLTEAHARNVCLDCKKTPVLDTEEAEDEYQRSALCLKCLKTILQKD